MAQSDKIGTVPTGTGLQVRTDFNDVDEAIASKSEGPAAPQNPVPFQEWAQASAGLIWRRNAANAAWQILENYAGTVPPTADDDAGDGYMVGSVWHDTTNLTVYV